MLVLRLCFYQVSYLYFIIGSFLLFPLPSLKNKLINLTLGHCCEFPVKLFSVPAVPQQDKLKFTKRKFPLALETVNS